jgi:hypothetical protein
MPMDIGYQFAPGADQQPQNGSGGQGGPGRLSPQAAVKLLSLRVPERPAQGQIAPQGLLQGRGAQGMGGGGLQAIIRALMAMQGGQGMQGGLPSPRVIPGLDDPNPQNPPQLQNMNLPPNIDELMARFRQMVPGGGFSGGMNQNQMPQQQGPAPPLF